MGNAASWQPSPTSVALNTESACEDHEVSEVLVGSAVSLECALQHALAAQAAVPLTFTAVRAAYLYGRKLATDPNPALDPVGLRPKLEAFSKSIDALVDCGYLSHYRIVGIECLGVARLNFLTEVERKPRVSALLPTGDFHQEPVMYKTKTLHNRVHIAKEEIPAFLLDNGFPVMDAESFCKHLKTELSAVLPISDCTCEGKYSISGKVVATKLGSSNSMEGLKPGEARYTIRIDEDFSKYTADPLAYEETLKEHILQALGLDPIKIPGAKKQIRIEEVREGSVRVTIVISLCMVAAVALIFAFSYYSGRISTSPHEINGHKRLGLSVLTQDEGSSAPPSPADSTRRLLTHVELRSWEDDWEVVGYFDETQKCYLPDTLFRIPDQVGYRTASELRENDKVAGIDGQVIHVMSKEVLVPKKRSLQTLRTAQDEITVTSSHRVVVIEGGIRTERKAGELKTGDVVLCGTRRQKLTKVIPSERETEVVQLGFFPDGPVETFQAPHWGILTLGHPHHAEVGAYGPLGPRNVNEVPQNHEPAVETQSPRSA